MTESIIPWSIPQVGQQWAKPNGLSVPDNSVVEKQRQQAEQVGYEAGVSCASAEMAPLVDAIRSQQALLTASVRSTLKAVIINCCENILNHELITNPELICELLEKILDQLPDLQEKFSLTCHPDDCALLSAFSPTPDDSLRRGDLIFKTDHDVIDGRLASRLQAIIDQAWPDLST